MKIIETLGFKLRRLAFTKAVRVETWQLLADLTQSGMPFSEALMTAANVYKQRGKSNVYHILLDLRAALPHNKLSTVAALYAPGGETLLMTGYGEADTHRLFEGMARIARADLMITRAITSAVTGPIVLFCILSGILYISGAQLYPSFTELRPIEQWPATARIFAQFTIWFANTGYVLAIIFAAIAAILSWAVPSYTSRGRTKLDRLPPFNFYKLRMGASFIFAVVEAGRMGQQINSSFLYKMAQNASPYIRTRITGIGKLLGSMSLGDAAIKAGHEFPARDLNTILAAFSTQENWLESLAKFVDRWLETVEVQAKRTAAFLNILLMSLAAIAIGLLMSSIFSITQTLAY